jgi:hypothetical protein
MEKGYAYLIRFFTRFLIIRRIKYHVVRVLYSYQNKKFKGFSTIIRYNKNLKIRIKSNEIIGWNILFLGDYETDINAIIDMHIKEGDVVVEAGANIGNETLLIADKIESSGEIFAFEPFPFVFDILKEYNYEIFNVDKKMKLMNENNTTSGNWFCLAKL